MKCKTQQPHVASVVMSVNRCDKLTREVREKEESLAKARADLAAELQASGGASIVPVGDKASPIGVSPTSASLSVFESLGLGHQASVFSRYFEFFSLYKLSRKCPRMRYLRERDMSFLTHASQFSTGR